MGIVPNFNIVVSEFELQSRYYVRLWTKTRVKGMNAVFPQAKELKAPSLFIYEDGFGIK